MTSCKEASFGARAHRFGLTRAMCFGVVAALATAAATPSFGQASCATLNLTAPGASHWALAPQILTAAPGDTITLAIEGSGTARLLVDAKPIGSLFTTPRARTHVFTAAGTHTINANGFLTSGVGTVTLTCAPRGDNAGSGTSTTGKQ